MQTKTPKSYVFYLNMQMLVDKFMDRNINVQMRQRHESGNLAHVRMYRPQVAPDPSTVYVILKEQFTKELADIPNASYIVVGGKLGEMECACSVIFVLDEVNIYDVFEMMQDVFEKNARWVGRLHDALLHDCDLDELCRISAEYFDNPIFVHNPQYYIIGNSGRVKGMSEWDWDESTRRYIVSSDLLNHFKLEEEYIETLGTKGAHVYSGEFRTFRCAYVNIWNEAGSYEGRLCINELKSNLKPGQFHAMEYLAILIYFSMKRKLVFVDATVKPFEHLLCRILDGGSLDANFEVVLQKHGWKKNDNYVCIKLGISQTDVSMQSVLSICNQVRGEFQGAAAFLYKNDILALINLSYIKLNMRDCIPRLGAIIREWILRAGISNVFHNLEHLPKHYMQAELALNYGFRKDPTIWCYEFKDIVLGYFASQACRELGAEFVCAPAILELREYDKENETEFYYTLKTYLQNDRNAAKTAKLLYIHRSTLFYRLDKIRSLINIDLDIAENQLYLLFSFCILDQCTSS